mmetsp:Transcript_28248/g.52046  ORF Transcript_28248/g.52046 Transcript_28248/m.52046 type:complete len:368 (-) Transcript_28248:474-1577(-)
MLALRCPVQNSPSRNKARLSAGASKCKISTRVISCNALKPETPVSKAPESLLRPGADSNNPTRVRFEKIIRDAQNYICKAIEDVDGTKFREDVWTREGGGGGISRVLQEGNVWEKAGVNVSVVHGEMPVDAYRAATNALKSGSLDPKAKVPFFAAGISSVMHPRNPHCPTMHFNYRYFETETAHGLPGQWWFGGGTDLTPIYVVEDDVRHFHGTLKTVCDRHDPRFYPRFKAWCDDYFTIRHRNEMRGLGGIFFDDLNDRDPQRIMDFSEECLKNVAPAYTPIIRKHMNDQFTQKEKEWQQVRRGRYVEFNLVYDRGTTFGLKTGGRTESILVSMPLTAEWRYDYNPAPGSPEAEFLDAASKPRDWA